MIRMKVRPGLRFGTDDIGLMESGVPDRASSIDGSDWCVELLGVRVELEGATVSYKLLITGRQQKRQTGADTQDLPERPHGATLSVLRDSW